METSLGNREMVAKNAITIIVLFVEVCVITRDAK